MKHNIGILIFGDPTRGGTIASEVKFLKSLYEQNSENCDFYIITVNDSVTKKILKEKDTTYNFPHKVVRIFGEDDFSKLDHFSCIVTYPGHSNFFGGYLNDNVVKMYKIISYMTVILGRPAFIRINDSEIKVRDYRKLSGQRLEAGYAAREEGKPDSAFMKDPLNVAKAENLVSWTEWDYSKVYWFANGSKEACDWVAETMFDREDEYFRMASRQTFVDNAIYVSDDIFFLVRKNYDRFVHRYADSTESRLKLSEMIQIHEGNSFSQDQYIAMMEKDFPSKFCYIGFFDTVNMARAKAFSTLFKANNEKVPMKIFGKGTEILTKLHGKENIEIEEGFIKGDSEEYFDFLNKHLAYLFIGKGQSESRYIGKTVYDAVVARTPVAVYKKCDSKMITFSNPEYYFEDENELKVIHTKLQDPRTRMAWVKEQAEEIFRKLPPSDFRFSTYCDQKIEIPDEICFFGYEQKSPKPTKQTSAPSIKQKSVSLF
jgi:hypothetical protein